MSKYINKKQLYFMVFIIIAFYVGRNIRKERIAEKTELIILDKTFRNLGNQLSPIVRCQMNCSEIQTDIIDLIVKNGTIIHFEENTNHFELEGRTLNNIPVHIYGKTMGEINKIDSLNIVGNNPCDCSD
jgi:hypothetical protein